MKQRTLKKIITLSKKKNIKLQKLSFSIKIPRNYTILIIYFKNRKKTRKKKEIIYTKILYDK